ncbi:TPA: type VI secretion system baseplate subunit TssF [Yersinia enterocolitica]
MLTSKLLAYYQKELAYLKTKGAHFAHRFPKVAHRLGISDGLSEDPHVERLIESFALLCANVQQRLDEDMPEVTHALLTTLAPQFLHQLPSVCIIQMKPDARAVSMTAKSLINSGTELYSRPVEGHPCRFRTVFPLELLPITLLHAQIKQNESNMSWRLRLHFNVWPKAHIAGETLRFYLNGTTPMVNVLYTLLCSEVHSTTIELADRYFSPNSCCVTPVGFSQGESLLAANTAISPAHTLLQEYFWFQRKFHFIDIRLPEDFAVIGEASFTLEFLFRDSPNLKYLESMAELVDADFFKLGCSPAINLFSQRAEPVVLNDSTLEYPVIPDVRYQSYFEVWAIDSVLALRKQGNEMSALPILPLFGIDHSLREAQKDIWWQAIQRESILDQGISSDWFIAFSDRFERLSTPDCDMIRLNLTCTNRNLPIQLINGDPDGDFESTLPLAGVKISALTRPTAPVRPLQEQAMCWRLISQLALNHQLLSGAEGTRVLKETLTLYSLNRANERLINLIEQIKVKPIMARLVAVDPRSMARGVEISIMFFREASLETEYFLLCQFLDHFLALYAPVNSFSQVVTSIESQESFTRRWPIRAGRLLWL